MNAWLTDASSIPNHDNGAFNNATIDPSMAFLQPSPTPQDPNQFQRMFQNGVPRNVSPGFHNLNQVIPSKRPRPEDGMSMSPRQAPAGLPSSRSQTPQVPFAGYQGPTNGNPQFTHPSTPYQHLQQQRVSVNTTQSPSLQDFDQHGVQRVQTASPSPFSPAGPPVGNQISPPQSDQGSRVNTPQNNAFMAGQAYAQGMPAQFAQSTGMTSNATPTPMQAHLANMSQGYSAQAMAAQNQRLYQMQLQNQARQMQQAGNPAMAGRPGSAMNPMANPQMAALRQMQQNMSQPNMPKPTSPEVFLKTLQKFMMTRNQPLELSPHVSGRAIHLMQLYASVMKMGGFKKVTASNMWPAIAQSLQFAPQQYPNAAVEIRDIYAKNLASYEQALISSHQKQQMENMQQNSMQRQSADANMMQFQQSPIKPGSEFESQNQHFTSSPQAGASIPNTVQTTASNGVPTPQQPRQVKQPPQAQQPQLPHAQNHQRPNIPRQPQAAASAADQSLSSQIAPSATPAKPSVTPSKTAPGLETAPPQPVKKHIGDTFKATVLTDTPAHGPIVVDEIYPIGEDIMKLRPNVPSFGELGVIDIHALTMSIKSGIHAEVRLALDTLTTIASEPNIQIPLDNCDDLVESLVDCAEEQVEFLAKNAAEVSDDMSLLPYEDVIRGCRVEMTSLLDVPEFGSVAYELDRAADRVLCITGIIRNFSFTEPNFGILGSAPIVKMFTTIIRYLGTRSMILRTHQNNLDFMKDAVTYLSNVAQAVYISGKEEAICLLHFLLSFAPLPAPTITQEGVTFTPYNPSVHKYTPTAIDSLAKLLARDEPNRMYYKAIFSGDSFPSQNELLTRAFALAICPIPDQPRKPLPLADARKIFLMQGLLAGEILTELADGPTARSWLQSADGFAVHLLRLCCLLSTERMPPAAHRHPQARGQPDPETHVYASIINRGLNILQKLAEKVKQEDCTSGRSFPLNVLPKRESLLGALLTPTLDAGVVRQLIAYAGLGE
ncbi:putative ARID/BRIGHT domain protein [Talaromyces proteolyticus]|uniref:ARID/BRIGHT domain protein n=1 Tax=Talaromyces proteolyticus TaxID=1131652 RepID=A0AAD4KJE8_9EURO|nr:putative ARID/BRIGHT domain protein [Talaromyces proteolyticus]KAH8692651.1 putative ARID/BRIGHT domain protein [Talaromyces proteolyticus]